MMTLADLILNAQAAYRSMDDPAMCEADFIADFISNDTVAGDLKHAIAATEKGELMDYKINLKNTTKDKLYEMLVKAEAERNKLQIELSEVAEDRVVTRRALDSIKAENSRLCNALGASERKINELEGKIKVLLCERDRARTLAESYKRGLDWCIEHPWKNLGKCWKGDRRY